MQGVLLESGSVDRYLALGKSGHPVSEVAQQILAVLQRHPQLQPFFSIPQRNQNGSVIDWYSPIQGNVIPWANASEDEKQQSREALQVFTQAVENLGAQHIQNAEKNGSADARLFGQLLQEACKIPSAANIYLVEVVDKQPAAQLGHSAATVANAGALADSGNDSAVRLQPVLTFWGFVNQEADRHRKPLYFLEPAVAKQPAAVPSAVPLAAAVPAEVPVTPIAPVLPIAVAQPWWKRWWWWLLLALLVLLMLWLLRGCFPTAQLPVVAGVPLPNTSTPHVAVPAGGYEPTMTGLFSGQGAAGAGGVGGSSAGLAQEGGGQPSDSSGQAPASEPEAAGGEPAAKNESSAQPEGAAPATPPQPPELPAAPVEPEKAAQPLEIPEKAADGVADFLNGKYHTRGGLVDKDTALPLRLQYAFENGKGQVEIQRPNGVSCKGNVLASMKGGQLGIDSQGAANCSDGSVYDMPQVHCKPGAQSAADCAGVYDNRQFPIQMQTN